MGELLFFLSLVPGGQLVATVLGLAMVLWLFVAVAVAIFLAVLEGAAWLNDLINGRHKDRPR
jgi:hypothetical protein